MCDCLEDFKRRFLEKYQEWDRKKVVDMSFPQLLNFETGKVQYYLPISIELAGQKKPKETSVLLKHCPLCGEAMA